MNLKKSIFLIAVGIASFIFFGLFLPIILSQTNVQLPSIPFMEKKRLDRDRPPISLSGESIILSSIDNLSLFEKNSTFASSLHCVKAPTATSGRCDQSAYRTNTSPFLVTLYDTLWRMTNDGLYQQTADYYLADLLRRCSINTVFCSQAFIAFDERYLVDKSLLPVIQSAGESLVSFPANTFSGIVLDIHKLVRIYRLTSDVGYLVAAQARYALLDNMDGVFSQNKDEQNPQIAKIKGRKIYRFDCGRFWVQAELSLATGDNQLFMEAAEFFQASEEFVFKINHLGAINMCLQGLIFMESHTGNSKYQEIAKQLVEHVLANYWDSGYDVKYTGDSLFLFLDYDSQDVNRVINFKYFQETAWFLNILTRFYKSRLTF